MVDVWTDITGHETVVRHLRTQIVQRNVHHAYLFSGPPGVGKFLTACAMAAALNCESGGCGDCPSCRKAMAAAHPGVVIVEPEGGTISIDTIRELRRKLSFKNAEGTYRVCIIAGAGAMHAVAANAFLKTLEEPPAGTILIVLTSSQDAVLETIASRCQVIQFGTVSTDEISALLTERFSLDHEEAGILARVSGGAPGAAIRLAGLPEGLRTRDFALKCLKAAPEASIPALHGLAGCFVDLVESLTGALAASQEEEVVELARLMEGDRSLPKMEKELRQRHKRQLHHFCQKCYDDLFKYMVVLYRDTVLVTSGADRELLVNADLIEDLPLPLLRDGLVWNEPLAHAVEIARARLLANVSPQLCLEALLFNLSEVTQSIAASS